MASLPGANLIDLRVLDANGMSSDSIVIAAIDRAISLKSQLQHPGDEPVDRPADL